MIGNMCPGKFPEKIDKYAESQAITHKRVGNANPNSNPMIL
jgi:hypothetical protein